MFGNKKQIDFIGLGDITIDAFIKLKNAHISHGVNKDKRELCLTFGDKIPYEFVEVVRATGNSANATTCASKLGLSTAIISNIGDDENGRTCLAGLKANKINTQFIKINKDHETNYHYILWYGDERTILVKHHEYDYALPKFPEPKWLYISSLGENSLKYHEEIATYLEKHSSVKLALQPGTFQIKLGIEKLSRLYKRTEIFFCNTQEAQKILDTKSDDKKELLKKIHSYGPKIVIITDGPKGAYAHDGKEFWFMPPYPDPKPPYERTGAGDAFSSTVAVALAMGKSLETALTWGPINSMSVVQYAGAQKGLLNKAQIEKYLKNAPKSYGLRKIID